MGPSSQGGFRSLADGEEVEFDVEEDTKSGRGDPGHPGDPLFVGQKN